MPSAFWVIVDEACSSSGRDADVPMGDKTYAGDTLVGTWRNTAYDEFDWPLLNAMIAKAACAITTGIAVTRQVWHGMVQAYLSCRIAF